MHKKDFSPSYCFHISRVQIIFPCRDIGPATATLDPRPRHWTRDRDLGPATATLDSRPRHWTRDPRPATISQTHQNGLNILNNKIRFVYRNGVRSPIQLLILTTHLVRTGYCINYFFFPGNTDKRTNRSPHVLSHRTTKPNLTENALS